MASLYQFAIMEYSAAEPNIMIRNETALTTCISKKWSCSEHCNLWILDSFDQMEEVGELTIHEGGDSCDQELIQIDKFTSDVEEAAIKLLASRLVVVSPSLLPEIEFIQLFGLEILIWLRFFEEWGYAEWSASLLGMPLETF